MTPLDTGYDPTMPLSLFPEEEKTFEVTDKKFSSVLVSAAAAIINRLEFLPFVGGNLDTKPYKLRLAVLPIKILSEKNALKCRLITWSFIIHDFLMWSGGINNKNKA